jgi:hypothetical protein
VLYRERDPRFTTPARRAELDAARKRGLAACPGPEGSAP